ncbi:glycerol dehydrogenase [Gluconacetobacter tumulicola]|uniref:Glycerol dehydrogenase n=1 Tax=Gluconacetobacter tumulicola TaxID=1017177 RepID=A0A7W4JGG3_9PROT|nr:glycerol dehydrogenase [Gluconacetobacter tumulicola]MBB2180817.1 glycerol dehydrogenase [Gluconacetobacter tumulicola]
MAGLYRPRRASEWATCAVAVLLILLGLPLLIMGAELALLGGSLYYVVAGAAIIAGGILMLMGSVAGAFLYLLAWLLTWPWALWEVGFDGWGLLPRVLGPTLIAVLVVLTIPVLRRLQKTSLAQRGIA